MKESRSDRQYLAVHSNLHLERFRESEGQTVAMFDVPFGLNLPPKQLRTRLLNPYHSWERLLQPLCQLTKMEDRDRRRILSNLDDLVGKTTWNTDLEQRLSQVLFSAPMMVDIKGDPDQMKAMYEKACKRGPRAYNNLVLCLLQSGNDEAARILEPNLHPINSGWAPTYIYVFSEYGWNPDGWIYFVHQRH